MSLFRELKRRNVFRVAAAYLAGAWLLIEVAETLFPLFGFGDTPARLTAILLAIGFPITLVLAWVYELTPEGLKLEKDIARAGPAPRTDTRRLDRAIIVLLVLALGYFAFDKFVLEPGRVAEIVEETAQQARSEALVESYGEKSIAVLPFVNMSDDASNEYFSDGISEELLNLLAKIPELRVIARTSSFAYKGKDANITDISNELKVDHVLEGSVRKAGDQVRITAQLIRAADSSHLWSATYDRTLDNIFSIQDEIAQEVVARLKVTLLGGTPTIAETSPEAYTLYLRGNDYFNRGLGDPSVVIAAEMYEEAVNLDPTFVLGHVGLAKAYSRIIFQGIDHSQERHDQARLSIETAIRLDQELPAVLAARGWYYYWALDDYETALKWFRPAYAKLPNDSELLLGMGLAERRLGLWNDALTHLALSFNLDPLSNEKAIEVGISFASAHDYTEAIEHLQAAITLAPDQFRSYAHLAEVLIAKDGSFDSALQALRNGGDVIGREEFIRRMLSPQPSWSSQMLLLSAFPREFEELEFEALSRLQAIHYLVLSAEQNRREGRTDSQHEAAEALLELVGDQADLLNQWVGLAYAHLGRKEEAERLLTIAPEKINSNARSYQSDVMMEAYGQLLLGDRDAAIDRLDDALSAPGINSVETILISPVWRDLRHHAGLSSLQSKYGR